MSQPSRPELAQALLALIEGAKHDTKLPQKIATYLVQERRSKDLDMLMRDVANLRAQQGILEATVTTAFPLSSELRSHIRKLIAQAFSDAKTLLLDEVVDPHVLGGLRIEAAGKQLDTSIQTKLTKLKSAIA